MRHGSLFPLAVAAGVVSAVALMVIGGADVGDAQTPRCPDSGWHTFDNSVCDIFMVGCARCSSV